MSGPDTAPTMAEEAPGIARALAERSANLGSGPIRVSLHKPLSTAEQAPGIWHHDIPPPVISFISLWSAGTGGTLYGTYRVFGWGMVEVGKLRRDLRHIHTQYRRRFVRNRKRRR